MCLTLMEASLTNWKVHAIGQGSLESISTEAGLITEKCRVLSAQVLYNEHTATYSECQFIVFFLKYTFK